MGLFTPANREHILGHVLFLIFIQKQIRTYFIKLFKLNERVIDYSDLVQSYVIFPLLKNQGFYLRYKNYIYLCSVI